MSVSFTDIQASYTAITRLEQVRFSDATTLTMWSRSGYSPRQMAQNFEGLVLGSTSVAVTSYQFFTNSIPSGAGLSYLVSTSGADANYRSFNTENRYINFAANLGLTGDGKAAFASTYASMTFGQAVASIYEKVIGRAQATAAGVNPDAAIGDITGRKAYFDTLARERMGGFDADLAAKAGLAGYIMAEAMKANVGAYARATENLYLDLSDGGAQFGVNLIGAYGPGSTYDGML